MQNTVRLKAKEERRLLQGHPWIYSNEIDVAQTPLSQFQRGQEVTILAANGRELGRGYINPNTVICVRAFSREGSATLDVDFFRTKLQQALTLRQALFAEPYYRLCYGESDSLPGLVIDRFNDVYVVQINTAGMECAKTALQQAMVEVFAPTAILLRNDSSARATEGLEQSVSAWLGKPPEFAPLIENGVQFHAPIWTGQKTGWFYDHRCNRARMQQYVPGRHVLDVFSYIGGWGVQAACFGAESVLCIDSSAAACERLQFNAQLNSVAGKCQHRVADAFTALQELYHEQQRFDVVILDPPAFIKKKKDMKNGLIAYRRLQALATRLLQREGYLLTASCSSHFLVEDFIEVIRAAGVSNQQSLQILEQGHQAPDHPIHPAIPESSYLKAFIVRATG